jgi:hypothetical protein
MSRHVWCAGSTVRGAATQLSDGATAYPRTELHAPALPIKEQQWRDADDTIKRYIVSPAHRRRIGLLQFLTASFAAGGHRAITIDVFALLLRFLIALSCTSSQKILRRGLMTESRLRENEEVRSERPGVGLRS